MPAEFYVVAGITAGLISLFAGVIYVVDILRGRALPHRGTWWVLGFLNCGIAISYYSAGASSTIWLPAEYGVSFLIIALLSLKYGEGRWRAFDTYCILGGLLAVIGWWLTRSAPIGLALFTLADFLALAPTIFKAYQRPWSELSIAWPIGAGAALLNVVAIDDWAPEISVYPVYVLITSALIAYLVYCPINKREVASL